MDRDRSGSRLWGRLQRKKPPAALHVSPETSALLRRVFLVHAAPGGSGVPSSRDTATRELRRRAWFQSAVARLVTPRARVVGGAP